MEMPINVTAAQKKLKNKKKELNKKKFHMFIIENGEKLLKIKHQKV